MWLLALRAGLASHTGRFQAVISVRGWVNHKAIMLQEVLDKLKKSNDLIGIRNRSLPARNTLPQPTTLPRTPEKMNK
jgi:hypothetical protein